MQFLCTLDVGLVQAKAHVSNHAALAAVGKFQTRAATARVDGHNTAPRLHTAACLAAVEMASW